MSKWDDFKKNMSELADKTVKKTRELTDTAAALVAAHGYDPVYGARPLKRAIQRDILDPLSMAILEGRYPEGSTILVDAENGKIIFK